MSSATATWFAIAGVSALFRWILESADPQYYDPESVLDYAAVTSQSVAGLATGIALLLLWRNPPVRRGSILLPVAGIAAIAHGTGNLLEDAFDIESGEWGFVFGGVGMIFALWGAGLIALTVSSPMRWTGLFLVVGGTGGLLGVGLVAMGLAWIAFSIWIVMHVRATANASDTTSSSA